MRPRVRLLPITVIAALLLLAVKVGGLWQGASAILGSAVAASAESAESEENAPPPDDADDAAEAAADPAGAIEPSIDVSDVSPVQIELLESLAARREELEARARELDMREKVLSATEQRVDENIAELKRLQASVEKLIGQFDEREEARIKSLVTIYEKMRPKDAARIFNDLDMTTSIAVLKRMREGKAAAIIARMSAEKAMAVTNHLAKPRQLPPPGDSQY